MLKRVIKKKSECTSRFMKAFYPPSRLAIYVVTTKKVGGLTSYECWQFVFRPHIGENPGQCGQERGQRDRLRGVPGLGAGRKFRVRSKAATGLSSTLKADHRVYCPVQILLPKPVQLQSSTSLPTYHLLIASGCLHLQRHHVSPGKSIQKSGARGTVAADVDIFGSTVI